MLKGKNFIQNLILSIIALAVILLMLETSARLYYRFGPFRECALGMHKYSEEKGLIYDMKPSFYSQDVKIRTNKYGMRDYEYSLAKSPGVYRICVLGDSVAFGYGLPSAASTFENMLEAKLNNLNRRGIKFEILNFSVTGYNSEQEGIMLEKKVIDFSPDMVLVGFCVNDDTYTDGLGALSSGMSPNSSGSRLHSRLVSYFLDRYEKKMFFLRKDSKRIEIFFEKLSILSRERNFDVIILIFPAYFENPDIYADRQMHINAGMWARRNGLEVIDFMTSWAGMDSMERKKLYLDDFHFSETGMKKIADELFKYLTNSKSGYPRGLKKG